MKTINSGVASTNATSTVPPWPDYVEESFDRLIATVTAIASVCVETTAGSDI